MANLKAIKKRIGSVKNTAQITKAMKMVAASKMKRAVDAVTAARPYSAAMRGLLHSLVSRLGEVDNALMQPREVKTCVVAVFASDRGLCGGFNSSVLKQFDRWLAGYRAAHPDVTIKAAGYGKRAVQHLKKKAAGVEVIGEYLGLDPKQHLQTAQAARARLVSMFLAGDADEVVLIYNEFQSAMTQIPQADTLLPISNVSAESVSEPEDLVEFVYEPDQKSVIDALLPLYLDTLVYQVLLETEAGEHGARMAAMDSATRNAGEMIDRLTLEYNRARQAAITTELIEIISGAEAL